MDKQILEYIYYVVYGGVTALSLIACCYMLFSRGNAFAIDITPPARLRRWAATFFAALALCHLWWRCATCGTCRCISSPPATM